MAALLKVRIAGFVEYRAARLPSRQAVLEGTKPSTRKPANTPARQLMWNVMRGPIGRTGFTADDLVGYGSTDTVAVRLTTARAYVRELADAGYLHVFQPRGGSTAPTTWRLKPSMNSGPLPPTILRAKIIWDQNRERIIGDVIAGEVPA